MDVVEASWVGLEEVKEGVSREEGDHGMDQPTTMAGEMEVRINCLDN